MADARDTGDVTAPAIGPWLTPSITAAVSAAVGFWVTVLALPAKSDEGISGATMAAFCVIGAVLGVAGLGLLVARKAASVSIMLVIAGAAVIAVGLALSSKIDLDPGRRLAIGVGGLAIAALVIGLQRFDTIRAVIAVPIVVLFVGIATWPDASELIGEDLRIEITRWIGILLGASAVGEGVKQAAKITAEGKATTAAIAAGQLDLTRGPQSDGAPTRVVLADPPGDLA